VTVRRRRALLDVNVLVALAWSQHPHYEAAHDWYERDGYRGWATTPVTESGFVRVSCQTRVSAIPIAPDVALRSLASIIELPGHRFWADDVRGVTGHLKLPLLRTYRQVSDAHLLTVADRYSGRVTTFDAGLALLAGERSDLVELLS